MFLYLCQGGNSAESMQEPLQVIARVPNPKPQRALQAPPQVIQSQPCFLNFFSWIF